MADRLQYTILGMCAKHSIVPFAFHKEAQFSPVSNIAKFSPESKKPQFVTVRSL
jgi:hypothetical protein